MWRASLLLLLSGLALSCCNSLEAQRWDSTYVEEYPFRYRINGGLRYDENYARFKSPDGKTFRIEKQRIALRIGGRWRFASYTVSIPILRFGETDKDNRGRDFGLGLRLLRRYGYFRTRFRISEGFRLIRPGEVSQYRDDIKLFTAFLYGYHFLNTNSYSLRASFNQRDRQLKSNGSFLIGGLGRRQQLRTDGLELVREGGRELKLTRFAQTSVGIGAGYAHTWIFRKRCFFTPFIYGGPEVRVTNYENANIREGENISLNASFRARLAVGYHGTRRFAALIANYNPVEDNTLGLQLRERRTQLTLRLGVQW